VQVACLSKAFGCVAAWLSAGGMSQIAREGTGPRPTATSSSANSRPAVFGVVTPYGPN
jgi:hypothetical protein